MVTVVLRRRVLPTVIAMIVSAAALVIAGRAISAPTGAAKLPDLIQVTPTNLVITRSGSGAQAPYLLGFRSAVSNVGDGPLIIEGHRPGQETGTMVADQVVEHDGAPQEVLPGVGELRYVVSPDHRHWHYLGFDRYELRRAGQVVAAVRDEKTRFCLGARYAAAKLFITALSTPDSTSSWRR